MKLSRAFDMIAGMRHEEAINAEEDETQIKIIQGSQGAGKTFSILQRWILLATQTKVHQHCTIVSDTLPNLKTGAIKDFETILKLDEISYSGTKHPYVKEVGAWTFEFFSMDNETKGLGSRRDRLFINEGNRKGLTWSIVRQLISRTHVEVLVDFNPAAHFWAHEQYVDTGECSFIKLTYKDNEFLPAGEIKAIERHAPWGSVPDDNYWRVYGLGELGFVEGMIFKGYEKYIDLPSGCEYQEAIGVDWGFSPDPMSAVKVWVDHDNERIFWKQLFYATESPRSELGKAIRASEDFNDDVLYCDHDNSAINDMRALDFAAVQAWKSNGLVADIRAIKQYKLFVFHESNDLIYEMDNYQFQVKRGKIIEYPDQTCEEHAIDAARYGTTTIIR